MSKINTVKNMYRLIVELKQENESEKRREIGIFCSGKG